MIILDTNVVSETMRRLPDRRVIDWLDAQLAETLYLTSVTLAELWFGVAAISAGKRQARLREALEEIESIYSGRILGFDATAAREHARLAIAARARGRGFPVPDGYIAAIASSLGFVVATRDTAPYEAADLQVINPWS